MKTERIAAGFFEPSPPLALGVVLDHMDPNTKPELLSLEHHRLVCPAKVRPWLPEEFSQATKSAHPLGVVKSHRTAI
jgi:hypothetical protein